jgi:tyrosyl-tRNA synthetase
LGKSTSDILKRTDERTLLAVFEGVPQYEVDSSKIENELDVFELLN